MDKPVGQSENEADYDGRSDIDVELIAAATGERRWSKLELARFEITAIIIDPPAFDRNHGEWNKKRSSIYKKK